VSCFAGAALADAAAFAAHPEGAAPGAFPSLASVDSGAVGALALAALLPGAPLALQRTSSCVSTVSASALACPTSGDLAAWGMLSRSSSALPPLPPPLVPPPAPAAPADGPAKGAGGRPPLWLRLVSCGGLQFAPRR
jgi:hypothetical protein